MPSTGSNSSAPPVEAAAPAPGPAAAPAEIVVALMSRNDEARVGGTARAVRDGLARAFGSREARILLVDAHSSDGTIEAARAAVGPGVLEVEQPPVGLAELPYHGYPGRAAALRAVFTRVQREGTKACAFIHAGIESIEPEWVERLIGPVLGDHGDYVSPYYTRRASDGAITKGIVYPMFRALYGARLRQPAATEFGCSGALAAHYLEQDFWDVEHADAGIDLWLAVAAVDGGFRTCEAPLGLRKISHEGGPNLSTVLAQVVGALFTDLEHRVELWQRTRGSAAVPLIGTPPEVELDPLSPNVEALVESFRLGDRELREIWTWLLPPRTIVELRKLTALAPGQFRFDDRLWASIIYDFAIGHNMRVMPQDHLLRSLAPLYSGWLASFAAQTADAPLATVEQRVDEVCLAFEAEKRHLIARWRWPERLR
jgi:hypothetical protein